MNLYKLIKEGKARVNCTGHQYGYGRIGWEAGPWEGVYCIHCQEFAISTTYPEHFIPAIMFTKVADTHEWVQGNGFIHCKKCNIKGTFVEVAAVNKIIPIEPISCNVSLMKDVLT